MSSEGVVRTRVLLGLTLVAAFLVLAWLDSLLLHGPILHVLVGALMIVSLMELYALAERGGCRPRKLLAAALVVAFVCGQYGVCVHRGAGWLRGLGAGMTANSYPFLGLATTVGLGVLAVGHLVGRGPDGYVGDAAASMLGLLYVWLLGAHILALRQWWGTGCVLALVAAAKLGDAGAYFAGTCLGRHKLAPRISPNKTVEGAVGGLVASVVGSVAAAWVLGLARRGSDGSFWAAFGLVVGAAAQAGDLVESAIKRSVNAKDSARLFPIFGGVLDVCDSLLLSAPVAVWLIELWAPMPPAA